MTAWRVESVIAGLEAERGAATDPVTLKIAGVRQEGAFLRVSVESLPGRRSRALDDSFEGARAWWAGEPPGRADVLLANPDEGEVVLRFATGAPDAGGLIQLYPPDFVTPLLELWRRRDLQEQALAILGRKSDPATARVEHSIARLRARQAEALALADARLALLDGPPGTGKTFTLGALAAYALAREPSLSILLIAPTNTAADQALLSIDAALERQGAASDRQRLKRIGSRFDARRFQGREHLLPVADVAALDRLAELQAKEPDKRDAEAWAAWNDEVRKLRRELRAQIEDLLPACRVAALTAASAAIWYDALATRKWGLMILDEASQVGIAAVVMLATLADRLLCAGDPRQLAAVVQSAHFDARRYLGRTAFDEFRGRAHAVRLNEQSRMAPPICRVVSRTFYEGELVVAADAASDPKWRKDRSPLFVNGRELPQVLVVPVAEGDTWSQRYNGPIRWSSSEHIIDFIDGLLGSYTAGVEDILVLVPFRAQRAMLQARLRATKLRGIRVSTVHRAQGGERPVVLFDPVDGDSEFLSGVEGRRLINVALSRAMRQLVLFLSEADLGNPVLRQVAGLAGRGDFGTSPRRSGHVPTPQDFQHLPNFPRCLIGETVRIDGHVGRISGTESGGAILVMHGADGVERRFPTKLVLAPVRSGKPRGRRPGRR